MHLILKQYRERGVFEMNRLWPSIAVGASLALAACTTAPPPPTRVGMPAAEPAPLPYRWTQGNAPEAYKAMRTTFGKAWLAPGEYLWVPNIPAEGETKIVADLLTQMAYVYRGEQLIGVASISSGKKGKETQLGFWEILEKRKVYFSKKYDDAPMPFMQRIDKFGIAFHAGKNPGYPASRGCIRLPHKFAEQLYTLTKIGSKVIIEG